MGINRRAFIRGGTVAAVGASLSLNGVFSRSANADIYGPLEADPDGILNLPRGFSYQVLEREFDRMDDGYRVPGRPDGMACMVTEDGRWALMRNHELSVGDFANGPLDFGTSPPPESYHRAAPGGVTRLVVDPATGTRVSSNLVLIGTARNCAGGPSPWGWLTCEENTSRTHGYVFLCDVNADRVQEPQRIPQYGRFNHEAVAIDPRDNAAYLTEDRGDSCIYRFMPSRADSPFEGQLQALRVVGDPRRNLSSGLMVGDRLTVDWVDLEVAIDPEPADTLRDIAQDEGAAILRRGEGIWYHDGEIYICSTSGGPASAGQIFKLDPMASELELIGQSSSESILELPDNITVAWNGDVYMAEDGGGANYIRVLRSDGSVCDFAQNVLSDSELAGVCFSPDGRYLFVNIQGDGLTLAITGPFELPPMMMDDGGVPDADVPDASLTDGGLPDADIQDGAILADASGMPDGGPSPAPEASGCGGCAVTSSDDARGDSIGLKLAATAAAATLAYRSAPADEDGETEPDSK